MSAFILLIMRVVLTSTFMTAAVFKINNVGAFQQTIEGFRFVPIKYARAISIIIIIIEITLSALFIVSNMPFTFLGAIVLLLVFCGVLSIGLIKREKISCNCFGSDEHLISRYDLLRNVILIIFSLVSLLILSGLDFLSVELSLWDIVLGIVIGVTVTFCILNLELFLKPFLEVRGHE